MKSGYYKVISLLAICGVLLNFLGCATIMKDKRDLVMFSSEPEGAKIYVDGYPVGTTPNSVPLERAKHGISFKKEEFKTANAFIDRRLDWCWYIFGNLIFGGIIGWIVDALTSEMWNLEPKMIHTNLEKE